MSERFHCTECDWVGDDDKLKEGCCPMCGSEELEEIDGDDDQEDEAA